MASRDVDWGVSDSSDDEIVSMTSTVFSEEKDEPYNLEAVLAERMFDDGKKRYLVKWEGYPDYRNTWEKKKHFQFEQTLLDWRDQKMQITRGRAKPFDVDAWEREVERIREATEKRRARRREKKISMGITVDEFDKIEPDAPEALSSSDYSSDESSSDTSDGTIESDPQSRAQSPVWIPREETTLLEALQRLKEPNWDVVLKLYGPSGTTNQALQQRTKEALRRKAHALKKDFDASGKEFPIPRLIEHPLIDRSITTSTSSSPKVERKQAYRDEPRSELVESLKSISKPIPGSVSKAGHVSESASSRKRKSDHRDSQRLKNPQQLRLTIPSPRSKTLEVKSATTAPKPAANIKSLALPTSAAPRLPSRLDKERPTQVGTLGRGPARKGFSAPKPAPVQRVNVMGNWGAQPSKRRKSRYEMMDPTDSRPKNSSKFKKFSTQRKYELASRFERTPDVNSLTFVNLKDGKVLSTPPASVAPKPPEKTPFQMLQESINEKQDEVSTLFYDTHQTTNEITPSDQSYINKRRLSKSKSTPANTIEAANASVKSTAPIRQNSLPTETHVQGKPSSSQPFAAPVAMMGSCKDQSQSGNSPERGPTSPHVSSDTAPGKEILGKTPLNANKDVVRQANISALQQTEGRTKADTDTGSKTYQNLEHSDPQRQKPSIPVSQKILQSQKQSHSTKTEHQPLVPVAQLQPNIPCFQPLEDGYALFPCDFIGPAVEKDITIRGTDVIAEILTGPGGESTGTVIFRGLEDHHLKMLFLTIRVPPRQMHVKCETMCTAGEYATFFHVCETYSLS